MKYFRPKMCLIFGLFVMAVFLVREARADDWVLYAASRADANPGSTLRDWYVLNRLRPVPGAEALSDHYFDRDSIGGNFGYGGIFRVWEKYIIKRETQGYEETKEQVRREEEQRLGRKITALDYARLFPLTVNRATKEIHTLYEINCDTREYIILEVNHYDRDGERMSRETNMDLDLWCPVEEGTVMEALFRNICKQVQARKP